MKTPIPQPCPAWAARLAAAHSDDLAPDERAALEAHLASCEHCRAAQERYAQMDAAIHRLPAPGPLPELPARLLAQWEAEDRRAGRATSADSPPPGDRLRLQRAPTSPGLAPLPAQATRRPPRRLVSVLTAVAAVLLVALLMTALIASRLHSGPTPAGPGPQNSVVPTATTNQTTTPAPTATATPKPIVVQVYFSHHPESDTDPTLLKAVQRISPDSGVATFALKQLFLGPTAQEQTQGYYSEFVGNLGTPNVCSDQSKDFTLALDHRGSTAETGTATVMLCRPVTIPGDLSGFRMAAMITQTLRQFPNIKQVVILNDQGNCFNDLRGGNSCLQG